MAESDLQSLGLVEFLQDTLESTLLADAKSVDSLLDTLSEYANEAPLEFAVSDSSGEQHVVKIPKLAISPMPLLRIQEADFEFSGQIEISSAETKETASGAAAVKSVAGAKTLAAKRVALPATQMLTSALRLQELKSRIRITPTSTSTTSNDESKKTIAMKMHVKLGQADIPAGLTSLLQIAASNLQIDNQKPESGE
ncbi:MAG: DUF2589 domain-containing protein [Bacteroidales bacterium]|nr:DUF2589 domain-containing protein [Bacteroidales bacterium]